MCQACYRHRQFQGGLPLPSHSVLGILPRHPSRLLPQTHCRDICIVPLPRGHRGTDHPSPSTLDPSRAYCPSQNRTRRQDRHMRTRARPNDWRALHICTKSTCSTIGAAGAVSATWTGDQLTKKMYTAAKTYSLPWALLLWSRYPCGATYEILRHRENRVDHFPRCWCLGGVPGKRTRRAMRG